MKTLIYTSIYSNLWGTEFGGRAGRNLHFKYSLKTILGLSADKFICFTSKDEIEELKDWFYIQNGISNEILEFIEFDLKSTKFYNQIADKKDIELMKTSDRCYEIQFNKFFWLDIIPELSTYDKVYWFDSGLSHGGLFPEKYSYGNGYETHFNFTLFNSSYLEFLNSITNDKIVILSKNNSGKFYWSVTVPPTYYNNFNNNEHVVGGFFGGNVSNILEYKNKFTTLLETLLTNETELYYEELLMSCLYQNYKNDFVSLKFDDWYDRNLPEIYGDNVIYFYNLFETEFKPKNCVCAISIEIGDGKRYLDAAKKMVLTHLEYTNYDVLLITNKSEFFKDIVTPRFKLITYEEKFDETIISNGRFNMHLKRYPIQIAAEMGYENIFYNDCDCYITGWDNLSFNKKCKEDFDVAFVSHANPQLGGLRKTYPHFQEKINTEFVGLYYDELDESPNPAETRVIFKNNDKLQNFLHFWGLISKQNNNYYTYHDGVYFGTSAVYAKMNMIGITPKEEFTKYCRIQHSDDVLDYFGVSAMKNIDIISQENTNNVAGAFNYKGLQMLQHKNVATVFKKLLEEKKPLRIIEIGTEYGGLTLLLQDLVIELNLKTEIKTYDIKEQIFLLSHPELSDIIKIETKDLFLYNPFRLSDEGISELKEFMSNDGANIILCDGSKKPDEFNVLSELINLGDVIMLHDYIIDEQEFELNFKNKIWNWHECKLSDIQDSISKNNLSPYFESEFSKVVWGCFTKN
jgi:hypothetical protein